MASVSLWTTIAELQLSHENHLRCIVILDLKVCDSATVMYLEARHLVQNVNQEICDVLWS